MIRGENNPEPGTPAYDQYRVSLSVEETNPEEWTTGTPPINYAMLSAFLSPRTDGVDPQTLHALLDAIRKHDPTTMEIDAAVKAITGEE